MKLLITSILIILIGFTGCSSSTATRKPVTNIQITPSNNTIVYGNEFTITVQSKLNKPRIVEIEIYINNQLVEKVKSSSASITLNSKDFSTGKHTIKTIAKNQDNKIGINYASISIFSDLQPKQLSYHLKGTFTHNTSYYTQGLEFYNNKLYEGTGNYDESFIYVYNPENKKIDQSLKIDVQYFGEGITILNNKLYQLTYKAQKGFVYDVFTLEKISEFSFASKEGWGLTNDGKNLIMSDGSSSLYFIHPENFQIEKKIDVSTPLAFISNINELEYVDGVIYANIWTTQSIVKIEAKTGRVLAFIDMTGLMNNLTNHRIDVLNGIAYEPNEKLFYVTGKWWPSMFKVIFE